MAKETKVITKKKKFIELEIPFTKTKIQLIGEKPEDLKGKTINLDLTRQLRGKSVELTIKVDIEKNKLITNPVKLVLLPYFIKRMIRKRISYVEDSFETPSQETMVKIKPFIITRKRVSKAVRRTIRNQARNWLEDYISERKNNELFQTISKDMFLYFSEQSQEIFKFLKNSPNFDFRNPNLKKLSPGASDGLNYLCLETEAGYHPIKEEFDPKDLPDPNEEIKACLMETRNIEVKKELNQISDQIKIAEKDKETKKTESLIKKFNDLAQKLIRDR